MPTYQKYKRVFVPEYKIFSTCAIRQQITREVLIQCRTTHTEYRLATDEASYGPNPQSCSLCPYVADIGCPLDFILFLRGGKGLSEYIIRKAWKWIIVGIRYGIWRVPRFLFCWFRKRFFHCNHPSLIDELVLFMNIAKILFAGR